MIKENISAIEAENLTKIYKGSDGCKTKALDSIDIKIERGSFFGLLGPNGAGKSTFINILAGTIKKTSGKARVCGYDIIRKQREAKSSIGVVPQELIIDPFFSVREALMNHSGYYGIKDNRKKVDEILEAMALTDKADALPRSLSGGMKRRLLIAKALVHSPDVLILDEPTAGVDIELRKNLWDYVRKLNREGTTIVLTTHYLEEAEELCDDIGIINNGKIIACDKKRKLLAKLDKKELIIGFHEKLEEVPVDMEKYEARINEAGDLSIIYHSNKQQIDTILKDIAKCGLTIKDITTKQARLEDLFKSLIKA